MKRVIDMDRGVILERFDKDRTESVKEKYQGFRQWENITVDCDGDIVLYEYFNF